MTSLQTLDEALASPPLGAGARTTELLVGVRSLEQLFPAIRELRRRCNQQDDLVTDPRYFISANTQKNRRVGAILIRRDDELEACVLLFEHCRFGIGLGLWRGGDSVGDGLVIGAECFRMHYVHLAVKALLRHWRTHGVSLSVGASLEHCLAVMGADDPFRMLSTRCIQRKLPLESTYDAMLAAMGPRTRRSLAKKRQQLESQGQVTFLPSLTLSDALDAMLRLRSRSAPERSHQFYQARHRLLYDLPEIFCMGLRAPDNTWLSLLSGWRQDGITYVDLQMNDKHLRKESLSAVMRAFMLEHEIGRGQRQIHFVGGTSLLLRRYCRPAEPCTDIFLWRRSLRAWLFRALIPRVMPESVYERIRTGSTGLTLNEQL